MRPSNLYAFIVLLSSCAIAGADTMVTVQGTSGPWTWQSGGLNSSYSYDTSLRDMGAPTVVQSGPGVEIAVGQQITISYVSGGVSVVSGGGDVTAAGGPPAINDTVDPLFGPWPSNYIPPAQYPVYVGELVGTFVDPAGAIVGNPFAIGLSATEAVPNGATQLDLGVNDVVYGDNAGSFLVNVSSAPAMPAPLPATSSSVLALLAGAGLLRLRRPRSFKL